MNRGPRLFHKRGPSQATTLATRGRWKSILNKIKWSRLNVYKAWDQQVCLVAAIRPTALFTRLLEEHFLRHDVETNVMSENTLLVHLIQRVIRCITITWRPSSSVNFYILIFFSETTTPIRTNLVGLFNRWSPT